MRLLAAKRNLSSLNLVATYPRSILTSSSSEEVHNLFKVQKTELFSGTPDMYYYLLLEKNVMRRVNNLSSKATESGTGGHYPSSRLSNSSVALSVSISQITSPTSIWKQRVTLEDTYAQSY